MHPLETFATVFFNIFGITQPSEKARARATWFLCGMLGLVALTVATGGWALYRLMHIR
jgi:hypothetical protein